jgi:monoterpene epsilon-lactone hydrolase
MVSEAFKEVLTTTREWAQSAGLLGDEFNLEALRSALSASMLPVPETAKISKVDAAGVPSEWICEFETHPDHRLLYLHGGGYTAGGLDSHRPLAAWISKASGCSVLLADYRLAPEHPFPAAVDDALTAFRWMHANGPSGKGRATHTFIAGDSAGGGLALAALLALRDAGDQLPHATVTLSAYTDLAHTGESMKSRLDVDPVCNPRTMPEMAATYLAGTDPKTPLASPLYADPRGLPPLLMQVGDAEVLLDDTTRYAEKAQSAGVEVTLEVWPEMFHVWQSLAPLFPEAQQAVDQIGQFIRRFCSS